MTTSVTYKFLIVLAVAVLVFGIGTALAEAGYYQCSDGLDNDSDGFIDYPEDPSCQSYTDNNEWPKDWTPAPNPNPNDNLRVTCRVSDTRIEEGDRVTFEAEVNGGYSPYIYDWDGDISGDDKEERVRFNRGGRFNVEVTLTDSRGNRDTDDCPSIRVEEEDEDDNDRWVINPYPYYIPSTPAPIQYTVPQTQVIYVNSLVSQNLEIYNFRVDNDAANNVIISFNTNIPANAKAVYSLGSHANDEDIQNYEFAQIGFASGATHQINLGQLEINRTYYIRGIASTDNDTEITSEIAFVQLPTGVLMDSAVINGGTEILSVRGTNTVGFAGALATLGFIILNPWLLIIIIIALLVVLYLRRRSRQVAIMTDGEPIKIG